MPIPRISGHILSILQILHFSPKPTKTPQITKTKAQTDKYIAAYKLKDGKSKTKKKHGIFSRPSLKMVKTRLLEYETIIQILSQTHIRKPFRNSIRSQEQKENKGKEKGKGGQQRKNPADVTTWNVGRSLRESDLT